MAPRERLVEPWNGQGIGGRGKVLTKTALKGARVVLCTPVCNFLELGQFCSPNSKGVSKGCAWGLLGGIIV